MMGVGGLIKLAGKSCDGKLFLGNNRALKSLPHEHFEKFVKHLLGTVDVTGFTPIKPLALLSFCLIPDEFVEII